MSQPGGLTHVEVAPASGGPIAAKPPPALEALARSMFGRAPPEHSFGSRGPAELEGGDEPPPGFDLTEVGAHSPLVVDGERPLRDSVGRARLGAQARTLVGAVDDHLEREADRIATRAMNLPAAPDDAAPPEATPRDDEEHEEPDERLDEAGSGRAFSAPLDEADLTRGGRALPRTVQGFFERRIGFDLSHVRVHDGDAAAHLNRSLAARAITYGNHVWLGRGEPVGPTFTMAHELTHVVQQTQPTALQPGAAAASDLGGTLRREFWAPESTRGRPVNPHDAVRDAIALASSGSFREAPVPQGTKSGTELDGRVGFADLYMKNTIVGIKLDNRRGAFGIDNVDTSSARKGGGKSLATVTASQIAPTWDGVAKKVKNLGKGPKEILVADVKPPPGAWSTNDGPDQLAGYAAAFTLLAKTINDAAARGAKTGRDIVAKGHSSHWGLTKSEAAPAGTFTIPKTVPRFASPVNVVYWRGSGRGTTVDFRPDPPVQASLLVAANTTPGGKGIIHYGWDPDAAAVKPHKDDFRVKELLKQVDDLQKECTSKPARVGKAASLKVSKRRRRSVQRKVEDNFQLTGTGGWIDKQDAAKKKHAEVEKTDAWKNAKTAQRIVSAHEALTKSGFTLRPLASGLRDTAKKVSKVEFWISAKAKILARLRKVFGRFFVAVHDMFAQIAERARAFFKKSPGGTLPSSGAGKKLIGTAWKVVKKVAGQLLDSILGILVASLKAGIQDKIQKYIPDEIGEASDAIHGDVEALVKKYLPEADLEKDDLPKLVLEKLGLDDLFAKLEEIREISGWIGDIATVVNWIKWGSRVARCATIIGCLTLLLAPLEDYLLEKLMTSCTAEEIVADIMAGVAIFNTLGQVIGGKIIAGIKTAAPDLGDFFKGTEVDHFKFDDRRQYSCDAGETGLTEREWILLKEAQELGEPGMKILNEFQKAATGEKEELTEKDIEQLKKLLEKMSPEKRPEPTPGSDSPLKGKPTPEGDPSPKGESKRPARPGEKGEKRPGEGDPKPGGKDPAKEEARKPGDKPQESDKGEIEAPGGKQKEKEGGRSVPGDKPAPGDEGTAKQGGKPKTGAGGEAKPGAGDPKPGAGGKGPRQPKKGTGKPTPQGKKGRGQPQSLQERARELAERLRKVRDAIAKKKTSGGGAGESVEEQQKGKTGTGAGGGGGTEEGGTREKGGRQDPGGGDAGGGDKGGSGGGGREDKGSGGREDKGREDKGREDKGREDKESGEKGRADEGGDDQGTDKGKQDKPAPGESGPKGEEKAPGDPGEGEKGGAGKGEAGKGGGKGTPAPKGGGKGEPGKDAKAGDQGPKASPTEDLLDLLDRLIEILEQIANGELQTDDEIESAIAVAVANAKKKYTADPNAKKIVIVFEAIGDGVGEALLGSSEKDKKGRRIPRETQEEDPRIADLDNLPDIGGGDPGDKEPGEGEPLEKEPRDQAPGEGEKEPGEKGKEPGKGQKEPGEKGKRPGDKEPGEKGKRPGDAKEPGEGAKEPGEGESEPGEKEPGDLKDPGDKEGDGGGDEKGQKGPGPKPKEREHPVFILDGLPDGTQVFVNIRKPFQMRMVRTSDGFIRWRKKKVARVTGQKASYSDRGSYKVEDGEFKKLIIRLSKDADMPGRDDAEVFIELFDEPAPPPPPPSAGSSGTGGP